MVLSLINIGGDIAKKKQNFKRKGSAQKKILGLLIKLERYSTKFGRFFDRKLKNRCCN